MLWLHPFVVSFPFVGLFRILFSIHPTTDQRRAT